ncbi:hypothetical protein O6H91_18G036000 [Diphasiastrum complanatum]|uniref:Uncharacterized protein n=1 Tax=Diphasiastrum complanatum TaxID=34168 RepID=A0ACC2AZQ8_DIPCM|nr:hypothetical protein O6H91_18G036000 [Diphasiastrum complanatum]
MHMPKLDQPKSTPIPAQNIKNAAISGCHEPCTYESIKLPTSIPQREMLLIWIIHASQGFQTTMLFPMLVFMVERYGLDGGNEQSIGKYAGILASLFPFAQFCTSWMWGAVSDRTGRKPWLAFGNLVSAVSSLLLGLCKNYTAACAVRFLGGLFNGTVTITKSMLGELCDESNQAKGFGVLSLAWGIGSISGSVITGWLAQPCHQYHINHCPPFLQQYPFFLPCTVATTFSIAAIFASWSLKETNTRKLMYQQVPCQNTGREDVLPSQVKIVNNPQFRKEKLEDCFDIKEVADESSVIGMESQSTMNLFAKANGVEMEGPEESDKFLSIALDDTKGEQPCLKRRDQWILLDRNVLLTTFCYSMTGLIFIITDELFPIFGAASTNVGGLGFSSFTLGLILGEGGVVLFLYTLLLYPIVARNICTLNYFRYGLVLSVPLWILFPLSTILSGVPQLQYILLLAAMATRSVIVCNTFTGIMIIVSNSATPSSVGAVTGLSHSCCSFFRAIGPALGGMIWSYATKCKFPFHQFLAWLFVAALSLFTFGLSFMLPPSLNLPKSTHLENM